MFRSRRIALSVLPLAALPALAACGSSGPKTPSPTQKQAAELQRQTGLAYEAALIAHQRRAAYRAAVLYRKQHPRH